jgi:hypothetical protein
MSKARDLANAGTALTAVSATELGYLDGVTSAVQTQIDTKAPTSTTTTLTGTQTLTNKTLTSPVINTATATGPILIAPEERTTVSATAATGTVNFDAATQGVLYYTTNASANWTLNVRAASGVTLASMLATGDAITISFLVTNGSTAYRHTALTIDGNAQTVLFSGGTAPAAGNASSVDAYSFTIVKTAGTPTYTVFGAGPIKYA